MVKMSEIKQNQLVLTPRMTAYLARVRAIMWSHHGFWNNLEQPGAGYPGAGGSTGGPPYYPGYDQDLSSYYKNYGYDALGSFASRLETDSPSRESSSGVSMSTPVNERCKEEMSQLTPPDSDSEREREDKPFRCGYPKCQYETNRRNNLKRHMMTMHERLSSPHFCCGVTFFRKADMRAHTKEVHSEGYPCTWPGCGKGFVRKALLDRHLKIHTGEKPFVCPICQYGTSHKSNLDRHVRIHFKSPHSPSKFYQHPHLYDRSQVPFLSWPRTEESVSALPDSTTDLTTSSTSAPSPISRRQSFLFSPDKFSLPFSPCNLDSITPLKLSPVKGVAALKSSEQVDSWGWSPAFTPVKIPGSLGLTPNTSTETHSERSHGASFLSAPATPPTPGKRPHQPISHGIRSILGDTIHQEEEEIDVDGDSNDEEFDEEDDYVPKKLRLSKKHSFTEA